MVLQHQEDFGKRTVESVNLYYQGMFPNLLFILTEPSKAPSPLPEGSKPPLKKVVILPHRPIEQLSHL